MADQRGAGIVWTEESWNPIRARWIAPTDDGAGVERVGWHCEKVSEACRHCYAEAMNLRLGTQLAYEKKNRRRTLVSRGYCTNEEWDAAVDNGEVSPEERGDATVFLDEKILLQPLKWKMPRKIFLSSMTDIFGDFVTDEMLDRAVAVMALCPQHTFQVLTKRAARMNEYFTASYAAPDMKAWQARVCAAIDSIIPNRTPASRAAKDRVMAGPLPNVWLGVTTENQKAADERIPLLLDTPAALRWVSVEPQLSLVDLEPWLPWPETDIHHDQPEVNGKSWGCQYCDAEGPGCNCPTGKAVYKCEEGPRDKNACPEWVHCERIMLDWVVAGGESGKNARPSHPDWFRSLRDQCAAAGVPFLFKQWGEWADTEDWPSEMQEHLELVGKADGSNVRVGKKAAGRLLDGVLHDEFPAEVRL